MATYIGIDLASEPVNTGVSRLRMDDSTGRIHIDVLRRCRGGHACRHDDHPCMCLPNGGSDEDLCTVVANADMAGIDVPFGWPTLFVDAVRRHHRRDWTLTDHECSHGDRCGAHVVHDATVLRRRDLRWRVTDQVAYERLGWRPLSVSSDRLGVTAMRMANIEHLLRTQFDVPIDRSGTTSTVVEVYPAGAIAIWMDAQHPRKRSKKDARRLFTDELRALNVTWTDDSEDHAEAAPRLGHLLRLDDRRRVLRRHRVRRRLGATAAPGRQ